jgi:uncharacterized protein YdeI (YjbR/CyaY-like superfamily)
MARKDPRIDAYIEKAGDFAKPILTHIRAVVHGACPDVEETLKWSSPTFIYKGMLCGMAAFKEHCIFGFWKAALISDGSGTLKDAGWNYGRLTTVSDLPPKKILAGYIRQAMALNESGVTVPRKAKAKAAPLKVPTDLAAALRKNKTAAKAFEAFSPSHRNEYVEWITEAKQEATRQRRLQTAIEWIAKGQSRNWKYESRKN